MGEPAITMDDVLDAYEEIERMTYAPSWPFRLMTVIGSGLPIPQAFKTYVSAKAK